MFTWWLRQVSTWILHAINDLCAAHKADAGPVFAGPKGISRQESDF
jgi:hypothetical protein